MTELEEAQARLVELRKTHLDKLVTWEASVNARDETMDREAIAWREAQGAASAVLLQMAKIRELTVACQTTREPASED